LWGALFLLALAEEEKAHRSLSYADNVYLNTVDGIAGYKTHSGSIDRFNWDAVQFVWSEGSLVMELTVLALDRSMVYEEEFI
jgi:hypothetical protein